MARVVLATALGGPDVLVLVDEPLDGPGVGEVRLAVRAAGINPIDWKRYSASTGAAPSCRCAWGSRPPAS
jgi:NADPH:quinone reductase-like Zn-dependent oxidoreductase